MSDYIYHKLECLFCGRKIIVHRFMIGVNHTSSISVDCAECLKEKGINKKWAEANPESAKAMDAAQIPAHRDPASVSDSSMNTSTVEFGYADKSNTGAIDSLVTDEISFDLLLVPGRTRSPAPENGIML